MPTETQKTNGSTMDEENISIQRAIGEGLGQAKENFKEVQKAVTREAKTKAQETQTMLTDKAKEMTQNTRDYVSQNPWKSVGVGAVVGLVFGLILSRRD